MHAGMHVYMLLINGVQTMTNVDKIKSLQKIEYALLLFNESLPKNTRTKVHIHIAQVELIQAIQSLQNTGPSAPPLPWSVNIGEGLL
jgi:hypothetical protein